MATLVKDFVKGRISGTEDEKGWSRITRSHLVHHLTSTGTAKLDDALAVEGMDEIGDEHPDIANMYVVSRDPESVALDAVEVRIQYERRDPVYPGADDDESGAGNPDYFEISDDTRIVTVETTKDHNGNRIIVEYDGKKQYGRVTRHVPTRSVVIRGRVGSAKRDYIAGYTGFYNQANFTIGHKTFTDGARTWRVESFVSISRDGGLTYDFTCELLRAPLMPWGQISYDEEAIYVDPETGHPPDGLINGNAVVQALGIVPILAMPIRVFDGMFT